MRTLDGCFSHGRPEPARVSLEEAVRLRPGQASAHLELGRAYEALGKVAEAEQAYREAMSLGPQLAAPHYALGSLLTRHGDREEGERELALYRTLYDRVARRRNRPARAPARSPTAGPSCGRAAPRPRSPASRRSPSPRRRSSARPAPFRASGDTGMPSGCWSALASSSRRTLGSRACSLPSASARRRSLDPAAGRADGRDARLPDPADRRREGGAARLPPRAGRHARAPPPGDDGSGLAWLDYDADGWMDVYVVQSGPFPPTDSPQASDRLFRNNGDGTFTDVTARAGLSDMAYGMGAFAADYDNDGFVDLLVTNWGGVILYRNQGDGTFRDVTAKLGLSEKGWFSAAAWADVDGDRLLDLFLTRYVDDSQEAKLFCGNVETGERVYCRPMQYPGTTELPLPQRRRRKLPRHHAGGGPGGGGRQGAGSGLRGRGPGRQARPLRRQRRADELPLPQPGRRAVRGHLGGLGDGLRSPRATPKAAWVWTPETSTATACPTWPSPISRASPTRTTATSAPACSKTSRSLGLRTASAARRGLRAELPRPGVGRGPRRIHRQRPRRRQAAARGRPMPSATPSTGTRAAAASSSGPAEAPSRRRTSGGARPWPTTTTTATPTSPCPTPAARCSCSATTDGKAAGWASSSSAASPTATGALLWGGGKRRRGIPFRGTRFWSSRQIDPPPGRRRCRPRGGSRAGPRGVVDDAPRCARRWPSGSTARPRARA